jgi:hypothetical protein
MLGVLIANFLQPISVFAEIGIFNVIRTATCRTPQSDPGRFFVTVWNRSPILTLIANV